MSNKTKIIFIFLILSLYDVKFSLSQWEADERLTNALSSSYMCSNNAWGIASSGDSLHVIWYDNRDGNNEIYYKHSLDNGLNWEPSIRLTNNSANSEWPGIAVSGSVVHAIWDDERDGNSEIYYKRSTDGGSTWGPDTRLTNDASSSFHPTISVSGLDVHVTWQDKRDSYYWEIHYKKSSDRGLTWESDKRITNTWGHSNQSSLSVSGSIVNMIRQEGGDKWNIYFTRSNNGGLTWGLDTNLTNSSAPCCSYGAMDPSHSITGSFIHVVWDDNYSDGNSEIYYKRSTNMGVSWETDKRLTYNAGTSLFPSISVSGSVVHVVWQDNSEGNYEIYYKRSLDNGISWGPDIRLTNNIDLSERPSIAISDSVVHVVWQDFRDGNLEIYYKHNPTGNPHSVDINVIVEGYYNNSSKQLNRRDTVRAFLRNDYIPFSIVDSALSVIDTTTFTGNFFFRSASTGSYYITLKQRNCIETWSKIGGESFIRGITMSYNFINPVTQAFGDNMVQIDTSPVRFGIYSGDINQDGVIDASDISVVENDAANSVSGYVNTDVTGDDIVDAADMSLVDNNAFYAVSVIRP